MIRSCRIPPILLRICGDGIHTSLLVTMEGELLGSSRAALPISPATSSGVSSGSINMAQVEGDPSAATFDSASTTNSSSMAVMDDHDLGTLIADIAMDYHRLGHEYAGVDDPSSSSSPRGSASAMKSQLSCLILEMAKGIVGVSSCAGGDCLVIVIADANTPLGLIKSRCQALSSHVQQALSTLVNETT